MVYSLMRRKHTSTQIHSSTERSTAIYTDNDVTGCEHLSGYVKNIWECDNYQKNLLHEETSNTMCCDCGGHICEFCDYELWESSPLVHLYLRLSCKRNNNVADPVKQVQDEIDDLKNSVKLLNEQYSSLQTANQRLSIDVDQLNTSKVTSEAALVAIKRQLEDLSNISYDGSVMLKICHFSEKLSEVQDGGQSMIGTQLFYSSPNGYKMKVVLYLSGDGQSTYLSMDFVLLCGEHDAILPWPFTTPIRVYLFDQTGQGHHVADSFRPDPTSESFQMPRTDANIASRFEKVLPLNILHQKQNGYVKDDTVFIKIMLDSLETSRALLPYTVDLNPALPSYLQDAQRRKQAEDNDRARTALAEVIVQNDQDLTQSGMIPVYPRAPQTIRPQLLPSTTNQLGVPCEDTLL